LGGIREWEAGVNKKQIRSNTRTFYKVKCNVDFSKNKSGLLYRRRNEVGVERKKIRDETT
jgi:hypothetical protein